MRGLEPQEVGLVALLVRQTLFRVFTGVKVVDQWQERVGPEPVFVHGRPGQVDDLEIVL